MLCLCFRFDGKPVKPPSSGYAMFSQQRLQLGQKMEFMGQRWRELTYNYQNEFKQEAEKVSKKILIIYVNIVIIFPL
jgi:hypothetical protein